MANDVKFTLEFPRGDSFVKGLNLKNKSTGEPIDTTFDEVYFTVKKYFSDPDFVFQKRMTSGGITSDGEGHYTLYINPEDTDGLPFGDYDCDFEFRIETNDDYKKTYFGKLKLTKETTHAGNE